MTKDLLLKSLRDFATALESHAKELAKLTSEAPPTKPVEPEVMWWIHTQLNGIVNVSLFVGVEAPWKLIGSLNDSGTEAHWVLTKSCRARSDADWTTPADGQLYLTPAIIDEAIAHARADYLASEGGVQ